MKYSELSEWEAMGFEEGMGIWKEEKTVSRTSSSVELQLDFQPVHKLCFIKE